ncbi:cortical actin cytoskeleton protein asp1 [Hysterangium stoloniferum]|nr:cortical actin cytoskeleton protein asp1 [Hysterangium stoloniferum]
MDVKARSKAMREILTRLREMSRGAIEVKVFGDKVILDEDVENWPRCDVLISFFSADFPLWKAASYVKLRRPFCINDLPAQSLLWDRRLVNAILDHLNVPTPRRFEVSRDGGPQLHPEVQHHMSEIVGIQLGKPEQPKTVTLREDGKAIIIDGKVLEKPFVEKPVSGEDHNVYIYFREGGGRRLFRKVGNKSSELDPGLIHPRMEGSYIYEEFIDVDNSEDIKVYTVGTEYTHAETRKSPVVDGVVRRNTDGKEIRFITRLTDEEKSWAAKIAVGFGQRVCGFDLLRCEDGTKSLVIDVNGWSFVKGNDSYYDKAAEILAEICFRETPVPPSISASEVSTRDSNTWLLKANVTVFRHADRTPKQKLKFNFPIAEPWAKPFVVLLNGEKEEIILRESRQLTLIAEAIAEAKLLGASGDDLANLEALRVQLGKKIDLPGTKAQLKPGYSKRAAGAVRKLVKLQLVFKWGGEFTHAAKYQSRDLGENMKKDISIMNKEVLNNVTIYTSSERRVISSAEIFAASLLPQATAGASTSSTPPPNGTNERPRLIIRKDLLDDSNAAKDLMDDVKKRLKILLRPGESEKRPDLTWPKSLKKEPVEVVKEVIQLLSSFRDTMRRNFKTMDVDKIQPRWCCGDEPWLFAERWEKLFEDFCDVKQEKFDPSRISELYDTIKYCALHHRIFLFAIFDERGGKDGVIMKDRRLHELYGRAKALFDLVAPQEYGIEPHEKEEIGVLTSLPLLRKVVGDLEVARNNDGSSLTTYFTKESHIHTLVNLVLSSGLPIAQPRIPEFELYERNGGRGKSDKEYSIRLSLSEGAHSSNVLDSALDARHSLNVQSRRKLTQHLDYSLVIEKLSKHFGRAPENGEYLDLETPIDTIELPFITQANGSSSDTSQRP